MRRYNLEGIIITQINDQPVRDIDDAKRIMNRRDGQDPIKVTFVDLKGEKNSFIFR